VVIGQSHFRNKNVDEILCLVSPASVDYITNSRELVFIVAKHATKNLGGDAVFGQNLDKTDFRE